MNGKTNENSEPKSIPKPILRKVVSTSEEKREKKTVTFSPEIDQENIMSAIKNNNIGVLRKVLIDENSEPFHLNSAIRKKRSEMLNLLFCAGVEPNKDTLLYAYAESSDILRKVLIYGAPPDKKTLNKAIKTGDPEIVNLAIASGAKPDQDTLNMAISRRNLEIIASVVDAKALPNEHTLNYALYTNNPEIVNLAIASGAKPDGRTLDLAISGKNLKIISSVVDAKAPLRHSSLNLAIRTAHPDIINTVAGMGAQPDKDTLNLAVKTANLDIVTKAVSLGARPNDNTLSCAIASKNNDILDIINELLSKDKDAIIANTGQNFVKNLIENKEKQQDQKDRTLMRL